MVKDYYSLLVVAFPWFLLKNEKEQVPAPSKIYYEAIG